MNQHYAEEGLLIQSNTTTTISEAQHITVCRCKGVIASCSVDCTYIFNVLWKWSGMMSMFKMFVPRISSLDWDQGKVPGTLICHKIQSCIGPWSLMVHTHQTNLRRNKNRRLHSCILRDNEHNKVLNTIYYLKIYFYKLHLPYFHLPYLLSFSIRILCVFLI
jgi:hypothetical protein